MPRIKDSFISELLERVDIVDVISSRISLKKSGSSYMACCPFHQEKSASFSVNQQKQYFNCFGCHEAGNAYKFIMKYDNVSFIEAVEEVAKIAGISVEYDTSYRDDHDESSVDIYQITASVAGFYHQEYCKHPEAKNYLAQRGISAETVEKYQIGFAPNTWDFIYRMVGIGAGNEDPKFSAERVNKMLGIGLLSKSDNGKVFDMFRNRLIIPIRDKRGRVIGFGGRVLDNSKPKYINSRESNVYKKGYELFNLDFVRKIKREDLDCIIITEGYMDVIALDQHGIHNAVASLGTATTEHQIDLLFKQTDRVVFCYDGDSAGRHAAWHVLGVVLPVLRDDKVLNFCFLPPEHDPDSLVRERGAKGFMEYMNQSLSLKDYIISEIKSSYNLARDDEKVKAVDMFCSLVVKITDAPINRQNLINAMAVVVGWTEEQMKHCVEQKALETASQNLQYPNESGEHLSSSEKIELTALRGIVARIIQNPYLVAQIPEKEKFTYLLSKYADDKAGIILDLLQKIADKPDITTGGLLEKYRSTVYEKIMNILVSYQLDDEYENVKIMSLLTFIRRYFKEIVEEKITWLAYESQKRKLTNEEMALSSYLERNIRNLK